ESRLALELFAGAPFSERLLAIDRLNRQAGRAEQEAAEQSERHVSTHRCLHSGLTIQSAGRSVEFALIRYPLSSCSGRRCSRSPPIGCAAAMRSSMRCAASSDPRGTIVYLHGIADNRTSASGVIERFTARRFDVVAYDSRAHGESEGSACTYGFFEKHDLRRVVDTVRPGPVILIGTSLDAAVALPAAAL